jgi:hypothetical protein
MLGNTRLARPPLHIGRTLVRTEATGMTQPRRALRRAAVGRVEAALSAGPAPAAPGQPPQRGSRSRHPTPARRARARARAPAAAALPAVVVAVAGEGCRTVEPARSMRHHVTAGAARRLTLTYRTAPMMHQRSAGAAKGARGLPGRPKKLSGLPFSRPMRLRTHRDAAFAEVHPASNAIERERCLA